MLSSEELRLKLNDVYRSCINGSSIEQLKDLLSEYAFTEAGGYSYHGLGFKKIKLYRARNFGKNPNPPHSLYEYVHPHPNFVRQNNRANRKNTTLFYGSLSMECAISELKPVPEQGDYISILTLIKKDENEDLLICPLGYDEQVIKEIRPEREDNAYTKYLNKIQTSSPSPRSANSLVVGEFFSQVFTEQFSDKSLYNLTIAISEILFNAKELQGIIFPSVSFNHYGDNLALTNAAMTQLTYTNPDSPLYFYEIVEINDKIIRIKPVAGVSSIDYENKVLTWSKISEE